MQTPRRPYLTPHRRQRLVLWALAMLAWIASVLAGVAPRRRHLDQRGDISLYALAAMVKRLILVRAADLIGAKRTSPAFFKHGRALHRRHVLRSVIGGTLRRALSHRDPRKHVGILIEALTHLDAWAERFTRRLRRRLTRLFAIAPAPSSGEAISDLATASPVRADSS